MRIAQDQMDDVSCLTVAAHCSDRNSTTTLQFVFAYFSGLTRHYANYCCKIQIKEHLCCLQDLDDEEAYGWKVYSLFRLLLGNEP